METHLAVIRQLADGELHSGEALAQAGRHRSQKLDLGVLRVGARVVEGERGVTLEHQPGPALDALRVDSQERR